MVVLIIPHKGELQMLKATGSEPVALFTFPDCLRQAGQDQLNQSDKRFQSDDSNLKKCFHPFASVKEARFTSHCL